MASSKKKKDWYDPFVEDRIREALEAPVEERKRFAPQAPKEEEARWSIRPVPTNSKSRKDFSR